MFLGIKKDLCMMKYVEQIAYILVLIGAAIYMPFREVAPYVFAVGAAVLLGTHLSEKYTGSNLRLKRNNRTRHLLGVLYAAAGYFMFSPGMYWLPLLSIAVMLELYTLWVISKEEGKE